MSELTKKISETIADAQDFPKVLRDVAIALKDKGFFNNSNWCDELIKNFKDVVDSTVDDSLCITDNEHEISSSFVDEPSKFNTKSKTSIPNRTDYPPTINDDLFEDSNDSFEIPETQPFPPVYHSNNDELDSEGFVTIPDDGFVESDCSQSQALLQGTELGTPQQSPHQPDFDDSDTIDMEMSKLQWDDSTKENDKNKSASVTPELDFNLMIKQAAIVNTDRGCVTPDTEFEAMSSALAKSIFEALDSPQQSKVPSVPPSLDRNQIKNDRSSIREVDTADTPPETSASVKCAEDGELKIKKNHRHDEVADDAQAAEDDLAAEDAKDIHDTNKNDEENVRECPAVTNDPFKKPLLPTEIPNQCDEEMPETQFFFKSGDLNVGEAIENRNDVEMPETQLFDKPDKLVAGEMTESNHVNDANEVDLDFDETQLFSKPSSKPNASSTEDDDVYNLATQPLDVSKNHPSKIKHVSLGEGGSEDDGSCLEVINVDVVSDEIAEESDEPRPKLRKRNRLIESSDEEDTAAEIAVKSSYANQLNYDDVLNAPTQKIEFKKPESPRRKCISDLKGGDWEQLCEEANNNQTNVVFKSVFDQCKDLRKVQENHVSVAPASKQNVVAEAPIRQSTRSRAKVKYGDSNDVETISSKRQKVRIPPVTFKAPSDSISTNSENAPPLEGKASKDSSNVSSVSSKPDNMDENVSLEMQHTQVFVKASSTPKERAKPDLPRRQARSVTSIQQLPEPKEMKQLVPKLRAKNNNRSATYSPIPANVKVSSDVNENVEAKPEKSDEQVKSSDAVSSRSRKRKIPDVLSVSNDSAANSSTSSRSPSMTRLSRHQSCSVMFTMIDPASHRETLKKLNISIAETGKYDVLITNKVYRTSKFMCALAAGKPIVSIEWLKALKTKKSMIDPFEFLLKDADGEKKYRFELAATLDAVQKNGLLFRNHSILVTPNTSPPPDILKDIITAAGGKYLKTSLVARKNDSVLCISDQEDKKLVTQMKKKYTNLVEITVEQFMQGIFQYKI